MGFPSWDIWIEYKAAFLASSEFSVFWVGEVILWIALIVDTAFFILLIRNSEPKLGAH